MLEQNFPLKQVDLLLVGSQAQIARWNNERVASAFGRVRAVEAVDVDYFEMKQRGAAEAICPVLAFVDSDVKPGRQWLSSLVGLIEMGHVVAVGLTQLEWHGRFGPDSALMLAFGSISWGAILGEHGRVLGFHSNNVGFRAEMLDFAPPRAGLLRACAAEELFRNFTRGGRTAAFRNEQKVIHAFSPEWWAGMHGRSGRESMLMRRMFADWPHQWVTRTGPLEPLLTALWGRARPLAVVALRGRGRSFRHPEGPAAAPVVVRQRGNTWR